MTRSGDVTRDDRAGAIDRRDEAVGGLVESFPRETLLLAICGHDVLDGEPDCPVGYVQWFQFTDGIQVCIVTDRDWSSDGTVGRSLHADVPVVVDDAGAIAERFGLAPGSAEAPALVLVTPSGRSQFVHQGEELFQPGVYRALKELLDQLTDAEEKLN
jgi:hypothetical protein